LVFNHARRNRRQFLKVVLAAASGGLLASCRLVLPILGTPGEPEKTVAPTRPSSTPAFPERQALLYVGTYAAAGTPGLYRYRLDPARGNLALLDTTQAGANPSFLAFHPNGRTLYAVNELISAQGPQPEGTVSAFAIDPRSGQLTFLNRQPALGSAPCHLTTDRQGNFLFVANYFGGSIAVYRLQADGQIGESVQLLQQHGKGPNPARQEGPHPHFITVTSNNRFALHCDLGLDRVIVYRFDPSGGQLLKSSETVLAPGAGPRHLDFDPGERFVYVINELDSSMAVFAYAAETGTLTPVQTLSTLPEDYSGANGAAEVCVHPSGKFVYGSNRGHDSLVIYALDESTGRLTLIGHEATRGKTPRHFTIDPSGTSLLVANQDSNALVTFQIDTQTGKLSYLHSIDLPQPTCLKFWSGEGSF